MLLASALLAATACSDDAAPMAGAEGEAGSTARDPTGSTDDDTDGDTGTPGPVPARGIAITGVYANQAVRVPMATGDVYAPDRSVPMHADRPTLIRVDFDVVEDWIPRSLDAEIRIVQPDGTELSDLRSFEIDGDSDPDRLSSAIHFSLPGSVVDEGMRFQVRLWDPSPGLANAEVTGPVVSPTEPELLLDGEPPRWISLTLVPIAHDLGPDADCLPAPPVDDAVLDQVRRYVRVWNPVDEVIVRVHEPISFTEPLVDAGGFGAVLGQVQQLRDAEQPHPGDFWYGMMRLCDRDPDTFQGGQAIIPSEIAEDQPLTRVGVGQWLTEDGVPLQWTLETLVHELGHNQGRYHSTCSPLYPETGEDRNSGNAPEPYPYPGAALGAHGWNPETNKYWTPTGAHDFMSYCRPYHVSDYGYDFQRETIDIVNTWGRPTDGHVVPEDGRRKLLGMLEAGGAGRWIEVRGGVEVGSASRTVAVQLDVDGETYDAVATVVDVAPEGQQVAVELPQRVRAESVQELRLLTGDRLVVVEAAQLDP